MTYTEIANVIKKELHVGGNLCEDYIKMFKANYKGDKRAIEDFHARYNEGGMSVTFTFTIAGNRNSMEVGLAKSRNSYINN